MRPRLFRGARQDTSLPLASGRIRPRPVDHTTRHHRTRRCQSARPFAHPSTSQGAPCPPPVAPLHAATGPTDLPRLITPATCPHLPTRLLQPSRAYSRPPFPARLDKSEPVTVSTNLRPSEQTMPRPPITASTGLASSGSYPLSSAPSAPTIRAHAHRFRSPHVHAVRADCSFHVQAWPPQCSPDRFRQAIACRRPANPAPIRPSRQASS